MRSDPLRAAACGLAAAALLAAAPIAHAATAAATAAAATTGAARRPALIDINSASRAQLKTLPGIGDEQAERIVEGRPYLSKADLVANGAIPAGTYIAIKRRIVALQKQPLKVRR